MLTPASPSTEQRALSDFHELLRAACEGHPPSRPQSVLYQSCRATLLGGRLKDALPGFVRQCASIERFREFIQLYDREPAIRIHFVDAALADSWATLGQPPLEPVAAAPVAAEPAPDLRVFAPAPTPPAATQVVPPPPAALDDGDGFMDDPDDSQERGQAAAARSGTASIAEFLSEFSAGRLRGAH